MLVARTKMESTCCTLLWLVAMEKCGFPLGLGARGSEGWQTEEKYISFDLFQMSKRAETAWSRRDSGPRGHGRHKGGLPQVRRLALTLSA